MNEWELVDELAGFMAYCFAKWKNKEAIVAGKLIAVNLYHEQWVRLPAIATTTFQDQGGEKGDQEGARGGREPDAGEETANLGDDRGGGGEHRRMGRGGGGSVGRIDPVATSCC